MSRTVSKRFEGVYLNKLANGDTSYSYTYYNIEGKKQRVTVGKKSQGITEPYVNQKRAETINLIRLGEDPKAKYKKKMKLEFSTVWSRYVDNKGLSDKIRADYRGRWRKHMSHHFSSQVNLQKLIDFRVAMQNLTDSQGEPKPLSPRSIDMMIGMIGSAIKYWNNRPEHTEKINNPVEELRLYDKEHSTKRDMKSRKVSRDRYLTREEVVLLNHTLAEYDDLSLFVDIALNTGARLGSIMAIQKKHVNGSEITLINQKTGDGTYTGFLNDRTAERVTEAFKGKGATTLLFTVTKASLQKRLQRILNKLFNQGLNSTDRVNRVVIHTLRHTFASHLVAKGIALPIVKKLMDHADINTTMRYSHLAPDAGKDAVSNLWD